MTAVTNVYLVRHAHSVYTPDERGRPLSTGGHARARAVAEVLAPCGITALISSPYKRAVQTIEPLAKALNTDIIIVEDLRERTLGSLLAEDFLTAAEKTWENFDLKFPGGESNREAQQRGIEAIYKLIREFDGQRIAVATHGTLMSLIMNHFDKRFDFEFWASLTMPDIYRLDFESGHYLSASRIWSDTEGEE